MSNLLILSKNTSELEKLKSRYPRQIAKLQFWATKRIKSISKIQNHSIDFAIDTFICNEVDRYLEAIAFSTNPDELAISMRSNNHLSLQEKAIIAKFFPFKLPYDTKLRELDWFCESHWYKLGDGQYVTAQEEILDGIGDTAIITRNAYDADILNANNMMIVDVDLDSDTYSSKVYSEKFALKVLEAFTESTNCGFRAYKTAAGLRYICTSHEFDPASTQSDFIMQNLFADDRYRALCRFQQTYRARLTPKPWRAMGDPDVAVCSLVGIQGNSKILPQFKDSIKYHDKATKANNKRNLPLA